MDENDDIRETVKELPRRSDELRQQVRASELSRRDVEALRAKVRTVTPRPSDEHSIPSG